MAGSRLLLLGMTAALSAQTPVPPGARVEWVLGERLAQDLDSRDGRIEDLETIAYLHRIETALTGQRPLELRLTYGLEPYARLLPNDVLYVAGCLLDRIQTEAELAGLLAHELAHTRQTPAPGPNFGACVLNSPMVPQKWSEGMRDREQQATSEAIVVLRKAGYDPTGVLDLLSKLAYENPMWGRGIVAEDLLQIRNDIEKEPTPHAGYRMDTSAFRQMKERLAAALGHHQAVTPSLVKPRP